MTTYNLCIGAKIRKTDIPSLLYESGVFITRTCFSDVHACGNTLWLENFTFFRVSLFQNRFSDAVSTQHAAASDSRLNTQKSPSQTYLN